MCQNYFVRWYEPGLETESVVSATILSLFSQAKQSQKNVRFVCGGKEVQSEDSGTMLICWNVPYLANREEEHSSMTFHGQLISIAARTYWEI